MKTIEEEAKIKIDLEEIFGKHFNGMHYEDITKEGIIKFGLDLSKQLLEFAQRWIPVEEELPENANEIILKNEKWITEYNPNGTRMGYMDNKRKKLFYSAYWDENGQCYSMSEEQPTHWRPIDLKYL